MRIKLVQGKLCSFSTIKDDRDEILDPMSKSRKSIDQYKKDGMDKNGRENDKR